MQVLRTLTALVFVTFVAAAAAGTPLGEASLGATVVPNAQTSIEGNSNNGLPFNIDNFSLASSVRYQQIYGASELKAGIVTQIAFRPDSEVGDAFSTGGVDVEIRLAHTVAAVGGLSTSFADNLDGNVTLVFDGLLALSSADVGGPPRNFDIVIDVADTFEYNGTDNLLLDAKVFGESSTTQFDTQLGFDSVSRVWANDVGATVGTTSRHGLVTEFTIVPPPPPVGGIALEPDVGAGAQPSAEDTEHIGAIYLRILARTRAIAVAALSVAVTGTVWWLRFRRAQ